MTAVATTGKEAPLAGASNLDQLRRTRDALRAAVDDGAEHLHELHDEIEDALIAALSRRRREEVGR